MRIETERLVITDFTIDMAEAVHAGSLGSDMRRFLPDEVFETVEMAELAVAELIVCSEGEDGPFVHPMLHEGEYVGYVQLVPTDTGWEIGYHTVRAFARNGFATEAVRAFLPVMMERLKLTSVEGVCVQENVASIRVLEKCGFRRVFEGQGKYQGVVRPIVRMVYEK